MIRRVYAHNFRTLVDFEWRLGAETLVLGANGSGKTSALDVIDRLRSFVLGNLTASELLTDADSTAWLGDGATSLNLDLEIGETEYRYEVVLAVPRFQQDAQVEKERLTVGGQTVFERNARSASLLSVNGEVGGSFPLSRQQSVVPAVESMDKNSPIRIFRSEMERVLFARPQAPTMDDETRSVDFRLEPTMRNLLAWLRPLYANSNETSFRDGLDSMLAEIWNGFRRLDLDRVGKDAVRASLVFGADAQRGVTLDFSQLSDGERTLVALYALAAYQRTQPPTTIIVDEPDNFVSLIELQPWLLRMLNDRPEGGQIILVSHNPEIIQTMGEDRVDYFDRPDHHSPTRVRRLEPDATGLSLSERMARGWLSA